MSTNTKLKVGQMIYKKGVEYGGTNPIDSLMVVFLSRKNSISLAMHYKTIGIIAVGLLTLYSAVTPANITCPLKCQCSGNKVKCIRKGLKTIPKGIPLTAISIDLSRNPQIKIPSDYFLQFLHLRRLAIIGCGQIGPVFIPITVKEVRLDDNLFTVDVLRQMISTELGSLKRISLDHSNLSTSDIKTILTILPTRIQSISVSNNKLAKLTRNEVLRFKDLRKLKMDGCSIQSIEANTFDHMRHLSILKLNGNKLVSLPEGLFTFVRLLRLHLTGNKLEAFNATKLGLKQICELRLGKNKVRTFDIRDTHPSIVDVNDNKIQTLDRNIFNKNPGILSLKLSNNNIQDMSRKAFQGIRGVGQLLLNNNSLTSLPKDLFKGMIINKIFLQNNQLSNLKGVFHGMKKSPDTVMVMENKGFTVLNGSELQSLPHESKIYLNCNKLTRMSNLSEMRAKVVCIPKAEESINTLFYEGFSCNGYKCKRESNPTQFKRITYVRYKCIACRPGYHSSCRGLKKHQSICIKCPAGSYYQDEAAKTKCKICRPGQFVPPERSPGTSPLDCRTCPQGTDTTIVAGTRACKCLHGYSRKYRFGSCEKCTDNGFNCSNDYQVLRDGYWMTWKGTKPVRKVNDAVEHAIEGNCESVYNSYTRNLGITDDTYDRQTMHFNCQMPLPIKCPMKRSCIGGIQPRCSTGYTGVICAVCGKGYTRQFSQCVKCPKRVWAAIELIAYIVLFGLVCFIISSTDKYSVEYHTSSLRRCQEAEERTFADILLTSLKILIGFYQVLISIIHALSHVHWPENLKTIINILHYMQFQVIHLPSLRCTNSEWNFNAIDEFWTILIIAITVPCLAALYYFIKSVYIHYQCASSSEPKGKRLVCGRTCTKYVSLFLFLTYTLITTKIIEILPISCHSFCTAKQNDTCVHSMSFLRYDYRIPCLTIGHNKTTLIVGYSCLIYPFGLPILLFTLLMWYAPRQRTNGLVGNNCVIEEQNDEVDAWCNQNDTHVSVIKDDPFCDDSDAPLMPLALKFTYENYHSDYWYWEVIEMIRKLLMSIGIVLFVGHTKIGLACTIIVAMIFTILHAIAKPFKNSFESGTQLLSLILIPLNLAFGAVLESQDKESPSFINKELDVFCLGTLIVVMNSCLIIIVLARIIVIIGVRVKLRIEKSRRGTPH